MKESEKQGSISKPNKEIRYLDSKIFVQNYFWIGKYFCILFVSVCRQPKHIILLEPPQTKCMPHIIQIHARIKISFLPDT